MELKIYGKVVEAELDLTNLKKEYKQDLNFQKAVINNLRILGNELPLGEDKVKEMIYYFTGWDDIIRILHMTKKTTARFRVCEIGYKNKTQYTPGMTDGKTDFKFNKEEVNGEMLIVINDLAPDIDCTIKAWIDNAVPTYKFATLEKWIPNQ